MRAYNVIFSGQTVAGYSIDQVKRNVSRAFKMTDASVSALFSGTDVIIKKGMDRETAEDVKQMMNRSGAICRIEPAETATASIDTPVRPNSMVYDQAPVITPLPGPAQVAYAPLICPEITGIEGGMDINRQDARHIYFTDIRMVSVCLDLTDSFQPLKCLFFIFQSKRPLLVNAEKIRFRDFAGVKGESLMDSLRGFLALMLDNHPDLMMDVSTRQFLKGARPQGVDNGIEAFATSLGKALGEKAPIAHGVESVMGKHSSDSSNGRPMVGPSKATDKDGSSAAMFSFSRTGSDMTRDEIYAKRARHQKKAIVFFILGVFLIFGFVGILAESNRQPESGGTEMPPGVFGTPSPEMQRQEELLGYNHRMSNVTEIISLILCGFGGLWLFFAGYRHLKKYQTYKRRL